MLSESDWNIRLFVYHRMIETGRPPSRHDIASHCNLSPAQASSALRRLHDAHTLFLRPGTDDILMANPLSAVATDYQVRANDGLRYANCAWDSLGIPAMLRQDAMIEARHPLDGQAIRYAIVAGELVADENLVVHFAVPFRHWYDDLIDA